MHIGHTVVHGTVIFPQTVIEQHRTAITVNLFRQIFCQTVICNSNILRRPAAILDLIEPEIAPFDPPPTSKTLP